jgi:CRP-like cAMP-binding protein
MEESSLETRALRSIPFFAGLADEDLRNLVATGAPASFQPGQAIVSRGDPGDAMYVVLSGRAQVDVGGRYHDLGPGDFFGEMALIVPRPRIATVKAVEPAEALRIPADGFQAFLLQNPTVALAILRAVVERLREVEERIDAWIGTG